MVPGEAQRQEFHDKGFIVMPGFFDETVMKKASVWLADLQQRLPGEGVEARYYEKSAVTGESMPVRAGYLLSEHNPEITELPPETDSNRTYVPHASEPNLTNKTRHKYFATTTAYRKAITSNAITPTNAKTFRPISSAYRQGTGDCQNLHNGATSTNLT